MESKVFSTRRVFIHVAIGILAVLGIILAFWHSHFETLQHSNLTPRAVTGLPVPDGWYQHVIQTDDATHTVLVLTKHAQLPVRNASDGQYDNPQIIITSSTASVTPEEYVEAQGLSGANAKSMGLKGSWNTFLGYKVFAITLDQVGDAVLVFQGTEAYSFILSAKDLEDANAFWQVITYYTQKPITPKIEWRSVSTLSNNYSPGSGEYTWYWYKDGVISCMDKPVLGIDIDSFEASSLGEYARDKNHVYDCYNAVQGADPKTFTILSKDYAKDKTHVFYPGGFVIAGADAATFSVVPYPQSPAVFDALQTGYGKDKNQVYNLNRVVLQADPSTFTLSPVAHDKNWIYQNDTVIGPMSLMTDNVQYSKALPAECNPEGSETIYPQAYPPAFSADGSVIGYPNETAICVIDKKINSAQVFPYGVQQGVSLSKDGSKILYFIYQKGDGVDREMCADCGQYSFDLKSKKIQKLTI